MPDDQDATAGRIGGTSQGIWAGLRLRAQRLSSEFGRIYDGIITRLFAPVRWLIGIIEGAQERARSRMTPTTGRVMTVGLWLQIQMLRLAYWVVYWTAFGIIMGPILAVYLGAMFGAFFLFIIKPGMYSQWVGAAWLAAVIAWSMLGQTKYRWLQSLGRISLCVAIGITPQLLFLCVYNGLNDVEIAPPEFVGSAIRGYEHFAVTVHELLAPIMHIEWYWWTAAASGLLLLCWVLEQPKLLSGALYVRQLMVGLIFVTSITASLGLSASVPIGDWEPDVQLRLKADVKEQVLNEAKLNLAADLATWFTEHPGTQTNLPVYVQNFERAMAEAARSSGERPTQGDIVAGARTAMRELVPEDIAATAISERGAESTSARRVPGTVSELLNLDADMKRQNGALKVRAEQARAAAVAVIAQVVEVQVSSVPLLKEIISEVINATAERVSEHVAERVPIEEGVKAVRSTAESMRKAIATNAQAIFTGLFGLTAGSRSGLNGASLQMVRECVVQNTRRVTTARVEAQRAARSRARGR
jgi:hypothetical protein